LSNDLAIFYQDITRGAIIYVPKIINYVPNWWSARIFPPGRNYLPGTFIAKKYLTKPENWYKTMGRY